MLIDLIHEVQWKETFYTTFNAKINWKYNKKETTRSQNWELDLMGLLCKNGKV